MRFFKNVALASVALATGVVGLTGCRSNVKLPVTFVAVTSDTYDAAVQFGDFEYKFKGKVDQNSNVFTLEAKTQQRVKPSSGGGGGGGFPPFGKVDVTRDPEPGEDVVHVTSITLYEKQSGGGGGGFNPWGAITRDGPGGPGGGPGGGGEQKTPVTELTLDAGASKELEAEVKPDNATNKNVTWSSSNPSVASVANGKITAVDKGTATITCASVSDPDVKATVSVTVNKIDVSSITLDPTVMEIYINEQKEITATVAPQDATIKDITWSSSDETIATVSSGKVLGVSEGKVTITAESKSNPTIKATAEVIVKVEDLREHDVVIRGTYTVDGYGYVFTFIDDSNAKPNEPTVIHADFSRVEGRHGFYYQVTINETTKLVHFQAKDPTFKNVLAKDYKTWDERDSDYIFRAKAVGNNSSVATAYLYMHKDGSAVLNAPSGTEREITIGLSWTVTGTSPSKVFTVTVNGATSTSKASKNPDKPGYMISVSGYTFLLSEREDVKWKKLETTDFLGVIAQQYQATYNSHPGFPDDKEVTIDLYLTADGEAYVYDGADQLSEGTYTEAAGVVTINMTYNYNGEARQHSASSVTEGDVTTIQVKYAVKEQRGPNVSWSEQTLVVTRIK